MKTANDTITECSALFAQIAASLNKSKGNIFGQLTMPFRDTKLELLRSLVEKLKSTLQLFLHTYIKSHQGDWIAQQGHVNMKRSGGH